MKRRHTRKKHYTTLYTTTTTLLHYTTSELQCSLITTQLAINHAVKNSPYSPNKTVTVNTNQSANSKK